MNQESYTPLLRITGSSGQRIAAVFERASHGDGPRPLAVISPAFEHSIRNSFTIARYLREQGFDVLRYDACNHVGLSDGHIADYTLGSVLNDLLDVVRFARAELAPATISVVATSLAGRVALRAARYLRGQLACVASIACVMDVRATLAVASGTDGIGEWLEGSVRDPQRTGKVGKYQMKYAFCKEAIEENWHTLESTLEDADSAAGTPFFDVHGELDPWVSTEDVLALASRSPAAEIVVLKGAVHELNAATSRLGLRHLIRNVVKHGQGRDLALDDIPDLRWEQLVVLNKRERSWERTPVDTWPLAGVAQ